MLCIQYVYTSDEKLVYKLQKPTLYFDEYYLNLTNDTIYQLEILPKNSPNYLRNDLRNTANKTTNLFTLLNFTQTKESEKMLHDTIIAPFTDIAKITEIYNIIDILLADVDLREKIKNELGNIYNISRLFRRIILSVLHPHELNMFLQSIEHLSVLFDIIANSPLSKYFTDQSYNVIYNYPSDLSKNTDILSTKTTDTPENINISGILKKIIEYTNDTWNMEYLENEMIKISNINGEIFNLKSAFNVKIKEIIAKNNPKLALVESEASVLNSIYYKYIPKPKKAPQNTEQKSIINIESTNNNYYLACTPTRWQIIKCGLEKEGKLNKYYVSEMKSTVKINSDEISRANKMVDNDADSSQINAHYLAILGELANLISPIQTLLIDTVAKIDYCYALAVSAHLYNYKRPTIIDMQNGASYIKANDLRHPISERIINNLFIPNDVDLTEGKSLLIFGVNASGKSIYLKSVGLAIIMAQMVFCPCNTDGLLSIYEDVFAGFI